MASQLRFEGGELEELLERVRTEVGPDARIVAANRVRQGGIAGFFARQAFEVVVEPAGRRPPRRPDRRHAPAVDDASSASTAPARAERTTDPDRLRATILDLADAVSDIEREDVIDLVEERHRQRVVSTRVARLRRHARPLQPLDRRDPDELSTPTPISREPLDANP